MCDKHYRRFLRTGDPLKVRVIHGDVEARFWSKTEKTPGCWLWTGSLNTDGYGVIGIGGTRNRTAHRWAYEHFVGPVPDGQHLDHLCRVRRCVNPAHLEPVTQAENSRRGAEAITHCPHGHEYTAENTILQTNRICRTCRERRQKAYRRKT